MSKMLDEYRYAADYVCGDRNEPGADFNPDLLEYATVTGANLLAVVAEAGKRCQFGDEAHRPRLEQLEVVDGFYKQWSAAEYYDLYDLYDLPEEG